VVVEEANIFFKKRKNKTKMKFLRRLGRKVKKGIKKLMGSKLGRIVGMIGLSMAMGAVAKNLIGKFGAKAAGEATATAAAEATAAGATEAATTAAGGVETAVKATEALQTAGSAAEVGSTVTGATSTSAGAGQIATSGETVGGIDKVIEDVANAGSNSEAATTAINHIEAQTMSSNGMINPDAVNVSSSITESVDAVNNTFFDPNYQPSMASDNLFAKPPTEGTMGYQPGSYETFSSTGGAATTTTPQTASLLDPPQMITPDKTLTESLAEGNIPLAEGGGYIERRSAGEFLRDFGSDVYAEMDSPAKIAGGIVQGVGTGVAMNMIMGEEEYTTPGTVMPQPIQEIPIDASIRPLAASYRPEDLMTKMKQINNPQNGLVFGTGSRTFVTGMVNPNALNFPSTTIGLPKGIV